MWGIKLFLHIAILISGTSTGTFIILFIITVMCLFYVFSENVQDFKEKKKVQRHTFLCDFLLNYLKSKIERSTY